MEKDEGEGYWLRGFKLEYRIPKLNNIKFKAVDGRWSCCDQCCIVTSWCATSHACTLPKPRTKGKTMRPMPPTITDKQKE